MVIYMSEQNPDWSDTMEGHVVYFIIHTAMRHEASYRCMYTHTGYLSWSRNAAICAGIAATVRIFDTRGMDPLPSVGSESLITGVWVCVCVGVWSVGVGGSG